MYLNVSLVKLKVDKTINLLKITNIYLYGFTLTYILNGDNIKILGYILIKNKEYYVFQGETLKWKILFLLTLK